MWVEPMKKLKLLTLLLAHFGLFCGTNKYKVKENEAHWLLNKVGPYK